MPGLGRFARKKSRHEADGAWGQCAFLGKAADDHGEPPDEGAWVDGVAGDGGRAQESLPFYLVQIANFGDRPKDLNQPSGWATVREAQAKAVQTDRRWEWP